MAYRTDGCLCDIYAPQKQYPHDISDQPQKTLDSSVTLCDYLHFNLHSYCCGCFQSCTVRRNRKSIYHSLRVWFIECKCPAFGADGKEAHFRCELPSFFARGGWRFGNMTPGSSTKQFHVSDPYGHNMRGVCGDELSPVGLCGLDRFIQGFLKISEAK